MDFFKGGKAPFATQLPVSVPSVPLRSAGETASAKSTKRRPCAESFADELQTADNTAQDRCTIQTTGECERNR